MAALPVEVNKDKANKIAQEMMSDPSCHVTSQRAIQARFGTERMYSTVFQIIPNVNPMDKLILASCVDGKPHVWPCVTPIQRLGWLAPPTFAFVRRYLSYSQN